MWIECCDPLDISKKVCKECPHLTECITYNTEEIKEIFEEKEKKPKIDRGDDVI